MTIDISEQSEKDLAAYLTKLDAAHKHVAGTDMDETARNIIIESFKAGYTGGARAVGMAVMKQAQLTEEITDALKKN